MLDHPSWRPHRPQDGFIFIVNEDRALPPRTGTVLMGQPTASPAGECRSKARRASAARHGCASLHPDDRKGRLYAIYGGMAFCPISSESAYFVQNLVALAFEMIRSIVQHAVG